MKLCKNFHISERLFSSVEIDNEEIKYICDKEMNPPDHCVFLHFVCMSIITYLVFDNK